MSARTEYRYLVIMGAHRMMRDLGLPDSDATFVIVLRALRDEWQHTSVKNPERQLALDALNFWLYKLTEDDAPPTVK